MDIHPLASDLDSIVGSGHDYWDALRDSRFLITGGTGFFGTWLLEAFARANQSRKLGAELHVLSRNPEAFLNRFPHLQGREAGLHFHQGDVESFEFPQGSFTHVIHAATPASAKINEESPLVMFDNIIHGARRVLEFSQARGVKHFLFTSSGAVYGKQPSSLTHVGEDYAGGPDPLDSRSSYGEAKRAAEFLCATYARKCGIEMKIARCFAFVGPHLPLDQHFAIGNFIRDGLQGKTIEVGGDGTPYRSYLYAADLVTWLLTILVKGRSLVPYNVGSEDGRSIAEIARAVSGEFTASFGRQVDVKIHKTPDPAKAPDRYVPATGRANAELGLKVSVDLSSAIRKTIEYHLRKQK